MKTDTIAAIATAMSSSGIGIVRISGAEAVSIAEQVFELKSNLPPLPPLPGPQTAEVGILGENALKHQP